MRLIVNLLGGLLAVGWAGVAADYAMGARRARVLEEQPPFGPGEAAPPLSIVVAACNEEEKLPAALRSLLAQVYLVRGNIDSRLADVAAPSLVLLAWLAGA
ncbi:MAG: hypothetical protein H7Z41_09870, partial [Cytophagales bacterium]|nr:hypothetical protein [Armatimonadota bacterium]